MEQNLNHYLHSGYGHPLTRLYNKTGGVLQKHQLIYPIFVTENNDARKEEIPSMPNQFRIHYEEAVEMLRPLVELGLRAILIFGVINDEEKDKYASYAERGPVVKAIPLIKEAFKDLLIGVDVCLCAYTDHGHCGVLHKDGKINNQKSIERLGDVSLAYAEAGADIICPSDMMDCRIGHIKKRLMTAGLEIPVMSYSAKFASSLYGPFRDACKSAPGFGDRKAYQLPPDSKGLAIRAVIRDLEEGADFIMIKPGSLYLDIISEAKKISHVPISVYHVSGEYSTIVVASKAGLYDLKTIVMETMNAFLRAGADIIITYFTPELLKWLSQ